MYVCHVCQRDEVLESHHINPIAYGGPQEGPQVWLCAICHRKIHTLAERVFKGSLDEMDTLLTPEEFERGKILIQSIVNAKIKMERSGRPADTIRRTQLEIPQDLHILLHRAKKDAGYTNLQTFIIAVLKKAVN